MMTDERARLFVVLADQIGSRRGADRVPQALDLLTEAVGERMLLGFERTAGDEVQGLTADPGSVVDCVVALTRLGRWRLGIGVGTVDHPLPASTRAARGEAYLAARSAGEKRGGWPPQRGLRARNASQRSGRRAAVIASDCDRRHLAISR